MKLPRDKFADKLLSEARSKGAISAMKALNKADAAVDDAVMDFLDDNEEVLKPKDQDELEALATTISDDINNLKKIMTKY